jgi:hypothetical protein
MVRCLIKHRDNLAGFRMQSLQRINMWKLFAFLFAYVSLRTGVSLLLNTGDRNAFKTRFGSSWRTQTRFMFLVQALPTSHFMSDAVDIQNGFQFWCVPQKNRVFTFFVLVFVSLQKKPVLSAEWERLMNELGEAGTGRARTSRGLVLQSKIANARLVRAARGGGLQPETWCTPSCTVLKSSSGDHPRKWRGYNLKQATISTSSMLLVNTASNTQNYWGFGLYSSSAF